MSTAFPINPEAANAPLEKYQLGTISEIVSIDPTQYGLEGELRPAGIHEVTIDDPYIELYSAAERYEVSETEKEADAYALYRREAGLWERKDGTAYFDENGVQQDKRGWGDPVSRRHFFTETLGSPGINAWRTKIPSAQALADLSDPISKAIITNSRGHEFAMDETARKWLTLCTDAVAIRSRGTVMAEVVRDFIDSKRLSEPGADLSGLKWMSVACGTALPAMKAAMHAGIKPEMMLVDLDVRAMDATQKIAGEIGFDGLMSQRSDINIFVPSEMSRLRSELGDNGDRPMLIDLMGIFEYTGNNIGVDPVRFLRSNYDMLHPGGRLVFGQMRDDRPVADFTMGVVSWPHIEMRSPKEFMEIIDAAGIPASATQLFMPKDGVYTIGVIDKPSTTEEFAND